MIAQRASNLSLGYGLHRISTNASDTHDGSATGRLMTCHLLGGQREEWTKQTVPRLTDGELRCVNTGSDTAGPGREVITAQGALPSFVQPSLLRQRQRQGRNDQAATERVS